MRRGLVFGVLSVPVLALAPILLRAQALASAWSPASGELSLPVRAALALDNGIVRWLPLVGILLALVWPFIVLAIAALTGEFSARNRVTYRDVAFWWCVSAIDFGAVLAVLGAGYLLGSWTEPPVVLAASVAWPGIVAFWVSLAAAYGVQRQKRAADARAWDPKWLLAGLVALNSVGMAVLPLLAAIAFRRDAAFSARDRQPDNGPVEPRQEGAQ
jgi:hypothetical protein